MLFFDSEDVAALWAAEFVKRRKAPANYTKPESIQKYEDEAYAEDVAKAALNPDTTWPCCIAYAINGGPVKTLWADVGDHAQLALNLSLFWRLWLDHSSRIGFCTLTYDIPVFVRLSQILRVKHPTVELSKWRPDHLDLYNYLTFAGGRDGRSLQSYCRLFRIEQATDDGTGADVAALYAAGDFAAIKRHATEDVQRVRRLAQHLWLVPDDLPLPEDDLPLPFVEV